MKRAVFDRVSETQREHVFLLTSFETLRVEYRDTVFFSASLSIVRACFYAFIDSFYRHNEFDSHVQPPLVIEAT